MKKLRNMVGALFITLLALTGCSKKNSLSPSEAINKATENMKQAQNYNMEIKMNMGLSMGESMNMDMSLTGKAHVDVQNGITYTSMKVNMLGSDMTTETYTDTKSETGKVISYTKTSDSDEWSKTSLNYDEEQTDYSKFFTKLDKNGDIKELDSDSNNYNYELSVFLADFSEVMDTVGMDSLNIDENQKIKMKVSIDKKTGNYTKLSVDMKEFIDDMMKKLESDESNKVKISKAEFVITISDFNNAGDVTIPKEALEAEDNSEFNFDSDDSMLINYFDEDDYDEVLVCTKETDNVSIEETFGFNDDMYEKSLINEEYTFDDEDEADAFYDERADEDNDDQSIFAFGNEVSITTYYTPTDDEKTLSLNDIKLLMTSDGYTCE